MWKLRNAAGRNQKAQRGPALRLTNTSRTRRCFICAAFTASLCLASGAAAQPMFPFSRTFAAGDGDTIRVEAAKTERDGCIIEALSVGAAGRAVAARLHIPHPVFRIEAADLTGDGRAELCVGVIKRTRYDTALRKRLFVYRITARTIRPLWLGSHIGGLMEDFRIAATPSGPRIVAVTREIERSRYAVAIWKWSRFGPVFDSYAARRLPLRAAMKFRTNTETEPT